MSSVEIAELTGKRHDNVVRDIRKLDAALSTSSDLRWYCESGTYVDQKGESRPLYRLDKPSTLTLISGYDPVMRMRIIQRWQELETVQPKLPGNYLEALEALVASEKQKAIAQAELEAAKPKIQFAEAVVVSEASIRVSEYAKSLSDQAGRYIGPNKLFDFMRSKGWLLRGRDEYERNQPSAKAIASGWLELKWEPTHRGLRPVPYVTGKGQVALANAILTHFAGTPA
jgi:Rha family phage regulatory protein